MTAQTPAGRLHVLLIDNFDSFTFNLVDELRRRGAEVQVWRNDIDAALALRQALALPEPRLIVISPGPGAPKDAGCSVELIRLAKGRVPVFGVCLGHQAIIEACGGTVGAAREIVHGRASALTHDGQGVFAGLPSPMWVGRYHSLAASVVPPDLRVTAQCQDTVMAVTHTSAPIIGVQFHPESILTPRGGELLARVVEWARAAKAPPAEARTAPSVSDHITALCAGTSLGHDDSRALFAAIMRGQLDEALLAAVLVALKLKGETPAEIAGAAQAMREAAVPFDPGDLKVIDTCGTGGDGAHTVNVSTAAALVAAALGAHVVKHGNRSVSSRCGSADVLEQCGVNVQAPPAVSQRCLRELHICFLFAPQYHAGVRHAMPVRKKLATRTIFNCLGPLANPARPAFQVLGVYDERLLRPLAETLRLLGAERALVVHGGGLDEIALHAPTRAAWLDRGVVCDLHIEPEAVGLARAELETLRGGSAQENALWLKDLLAGRGSEPHQHAVALNAGAALWVAGRARDLQDGVDQALRGLRAGVAAELLARWAELSPSG